MKSQTMWLVIGLVIIVLGGWMFMKYRKHEAPVAAPVVTEMPAPVTTEAAPVMPTAELPATK
jgi:LPXTG-motif cell wall-anchored protein